MHKKIILPILFGALLFQFSASAKIDSVSVRNNEKFIHSIFLGFDNDNYLTTLKNNFKLKEGNDLGYTYGLYSKLNFLKGNTNYSFFYSKKLFTTGINFSNGKPMWAQDLSTLQWQRMINFINSDKFLFSIKQEKKISIEAGMGIEKRTRVVGGFLSAANIQRYFHRRVINAHGYYYTLQNGEPASVSGIKHPSYLAENIDYAISPYSFLMHFMVGFHQPIFKKKWNTEINNGFDFSSEKKPFIGYNSNFFNQIIIARYLSSTKKFQPSYSQTLRLYPTPFKNYTYVGFTPSLKFGYQILLKKCSFTPLFSIYKPFGRNDFVEFNDADMILNLELVIKF